MSTHVAFTLDQIIPEKKDVLKSQGIPFGVDYPYVINMLYDEAMKIFKEKVDPKCKVSEISQDDFTSIFYGEGNNDEDAILKYS